jgi:glucose-1-phosphate cytidylyltransferase
MHGPNRDIELLSRDMDDWRITFVDTGLHANLGQRLLRVRKFVQDEPMFLANYSDGLSDLPLDSYVDGFRQRNAVASLVTVRPSQSFHAVHADEDGTVTEVRSVSASDYWINGGFFCLRREIFDVMREGEELVEAPFARLVEQRRLWTRRYTGFWAAMDTFKDKITFDRMEGRGDCPWKVWKR